QKIERTCHPERSEGSPAQLRWGSLAVFAARDDTSLDDAPERRMRALRLIVERFDGGVADAARRNVDHAFDRRRVVRPNSEPNVREDIFDLGALVKLHAADDGVRNVRAQQLLFE